jgi:hypothetical protein
MEKHIITKSELVEIKRLRKEAENNYKIMKKVVSPELQLAHLERVLLAYKKIYTIQPPNVTDNIAYKMIKTHYKMMCAMRHIRPNQECI